MTIVAASEELPERIVGARSLADPTATLPGRAAFAFQRADAGAEAAETDRDQRQAGSLQHVDRVQFRLREGDDGITERFITVTDNQSRSIDGLRGRLKREEMQDEDDEQQERRGAEDVHAATGDSAAGVAVMTIGKARPTIAGNAWTVAKRLSSGGSAWKRNAPLAF